METSVVDTLMPLATQLKGDVTTIGLYAIGAGLGIYVIFWGARFIKKQISKNAK